MLKHVVLSVLTVWASGSSLICLYRWDNMKLLSLCSDRWTDSVWTSVNLCSFKKHKPAPTQKLFTLSHCWQHGQVLNRPTSHRSGAQGVRKPLVKTPQNQNEQNETQLSIINKDKDKLTSTDTKPEQWGSNSVNKDTVWGSRCGGFSVGVSCGVLTMGVSVWWSQCGGLSMGVCWCHDLSLLTVGLSWQTPGGPTMGAKPPFYFSKSARGSY